MTNELLSAAAALVAAALTMPVAVEPLRGFHGGGTVTLARGGAALVDLRELPPRSRVRVVVQAGTCARTSASFASTATLPVDGRGRAAGRGVVRFHGRPVPLSALTDGPHAVSVLVDGRRALCGELRP